MKPEPPRRLLGQDRVPSLSLGGKTVVCVLRWQISDEYRLSQCAPLTIKRLVVCNTFIALAAKPGPPVRQIWCQCGTSDRCQTFETNLEEGTNREINLDAIWNELPQWRSFDGSQWESLAASWGRSLRWTPRSWGCLNRHSNRCWWSCFHPNCKERKMRCYYHSEPLKTCKHNLT